MRDFHHHPARRPHPGLIGPTAPARRRISQADPRRHRSPDEGPRAAVAPAGRWPTSTSCATQLDPEAPLTRSHQPGSGLRRDRRVTAPTSSLPGRFPVRRGPARRSGRCPAASVTACPACSPGRPTCWCSTGHQDIDIPDPRPARRAAGQLRRHGVPGQPRPPTGQRGDQHHRLGEAGAVARAEVPKSGVEDWRWCRPAPARAPPPKGDAKPGDLGQAPSASSLKRRRLDELPASSSRDRQRPSSDTQPAPRSTAPNAANSMPVLPEPVPPSNELMAALDAESAVGTAEAYAGGQVWSRQQGRPGCCGLNGTACCWRSSPSWPGAMGLAMAWTMQPGSARRQRASRIPAS